MFLLLLTCAAAISHTISPTQRHGGEGVFMSEDAWSHNDDGSQRASALSYGVCVEIAVEAAKADVGSRRCKETLHATAVSPMSTF